MFLLCQTVNLLISSPQVKTFMILKRININPELLIKMVASKLRICAETHAQDNTYHILGNILPHLEGLSGKYSVTNSMTWHPVSHTSTAQ